MLASLGGCGGGSEPETPEHADPAPAQPEEPAGLPAVEATDDGASEVPVIEQGGAQLVEPELIGDAETAEAIEQGEAGSPLASLPGFTPTDPEVAAGGDDTDEGGLEPVTGIAPLDAPVRIQVTVVGLTPTTPELLAPLEQFLTAEEAATLDAQEVRALFELLGTMEAAGSASIISRPSAIITGGQEGALSITTLGAGEDLRLKLSPRIDEPSPDTGDQLVRVRYDFAFTDPETVLEVVAQDLGLSVGPRARVAGTGVVRSGDAFFVVRRVVGSDDDRELLVLIRPQVMQQELNK